MALQKAILTQEEPSVSGWFVCADCLQHTRDFAIMRYMHVNLFTTDINIDTVHFYLMLK